MGTPIDNIELRFGFKLPAAFFSMSDAGLFSCDRPSHLQLTDFHWLSPAQAALQATPVRGGHLLSFGESGNGDRWCWNSAWATAERVPVVFAPRGCKVALGYAGDIAAAVYRRLLEEFSSSWLLGTFVHSTEELEARFRQYAESVSPHVPVKWAKTLLEASKRPVREISGGVYGTLQAQEVQAIIERDLAFAQLGQSIKLRA